MKKEPTFQTYTERLIDSLIAARREGTAHIYRSMLRRVEDFAGTEHDLRFRHITPAWLTAFQNYLLARGAKWNTVSTYLRMLRAVYLRAVDEGLTLYRPRLFHSVYTGTRATAKRALDEQTLRHLYASAPLPDRKLEQTRRLFLLLFMLRGIPFVDIAYLRRCDLHGNILAYRRRKTGAGLSVRIEEEAMKLICSLQNPDPHSHYLFPFIRKPGKYEYRQYQNALRRINYNLKLLAHQIDCPEILTTYCARHSWATIANFRDYQHELICNAMGHSSVKVTEIYLKKHSEERIHAMNKEILSHIFHSSAPRFSERAQTGTKAAVTW